MIEGRPRDALSLNYSVHDRQLVYSVPPTVIWRLLEEEEGEEELGFEDLFFNLVEEPAYKTLCRLHLICTLFYGCFWQYCWGFYFYFFSGGGVFLCYIQKIFNMVFTNLLVIWLDFMFWNFLQQSKLWCGLILCPSTLLLLLFQLQNKALNRSVFAT